MKTLLQFLALLILGNVAAWTYYVWLYGGELSFIAALKFPAFALACALGFVWLNPQILERVKEGEPSVVEDVLYTGAQLGGLYRIVSLFLGYAIGLWFNFTWHFEWVSNQGFLVQIACAVVVLTFLEYWHHRLMHQGDLWQFHETHHSAKTFNGFTTFRVHVFDALGGGLCMFLGITVLGLKPDVVTAYTIANLIYQMWVHTDATAPSWVSWFVITPQEHRVHHSFDPQDYDKNFSILTLWDRLFRTYKPA